MIAFKDGLIGIPPSSIDALSSYLQVTTQARADQMVAEFKSLNKTLSQVREFLVERSLKFHREVHHLNHLRLSLLFWKNCMELRQSYSKVQGMCLGCSNYWK